MYMKVCVRIEYIWIFGYVHASAAYALPIYTYNEYPAHPFAHLLTPAQARKEQLYWLRGAIFSSHRPRHICGNHMPTCISRMSVVLIFAPRVLMLRCRSTDGRHTPRPTFMRCGPLSIYAVPFYLPTYTLPYPTHDILPDSPAYPFSQAQTQSRYKDRLGTIGWQMRHLAHTYICRHSPPPPTHTHCIDR